jgi:hypothetical protein
MQTSLKFGKQDFAGGRWQPGSQSVEIIYCTFATPFLSINQRLTLFWKQGRKLILKHMVAR